MRLTRFLLFWAVSARDTEGALWQEVAVRNSCSTRWGGAVLVLKEMAFGTHCVCAACLGGSKVGPIRSVCWASGARGWAAARASGGCARAVAKLLGARLRRTAQKFCGAVRASYAYEKKGSYACNIIIIITHTKGKRKSGERSTRHDTQHAGQPNNKQNNRNTRAQRRILTHVLGVEAGRQRDRP